MHVFSQRAFAAAFALAALALPTASATSAAGSTPCSGVGVTSADAGSLAAIISGHPAGTTFCLGPGEYHLTATIKPAIGDVFIGSGSGAGGTEFRGDTLLSGWTPSGGLFTHSGDVSSQTLTGLCANAGKACRYPDDVFWNGAFLSRVLAPCSTSNVVSGSYCIDYTSKTVYLHDDPSGSVITHATLPVAISAGTGVQLSHLAITHFSSVAQNAAVFVGSSSVADDLVVAYNHAGGLRLVGTGPIVRNSRLHDNGEEGAAGQSTGALFENNEVDHNNVLNYDASWDAGGAKFAHTVNITVRDNHFHDNTGSGLWFDVDNTGPTISGNLSDHNRIGDGGGDGIRLEVACNATITGNSLVSNDRHGISIANSYNMTFGVSGGGNTVSGNSGAAVWLVGNGRVERPRPLCHPGGGVYPETDDVIQYNSIQLPAGVLVGFTIKGGTPTTGTHFVANSYTSASGCASSAWRPIGGGKMAFSAWQSAGQDLLTGSCS